MPHSDSNNLYGSIRSQIGQNAISAYDTSFESSQLDDIAENLSNWTVQNLGDVHAVRIRNLAEQASLALEVTGPDMPFLVNSILNACSAHGLSVKALFHPIVEIEDKRRSTIHIQLPAIKPSESQHLVSDIAICLADVRAAVNDYGELKDLMKSEIDNLRKNQRLDVTERAEAVAFLDWLMDEHFVFLGARKYVFQTDGDGELLGEEPDIVENSNLGLLRDEAVSVLARGSEPTVITPEIRSFLQEPEPLIIAKSTLVSRVHRRVFADYVGIKHYDDKGNVFGETRLLGLFTATAYDETARSIPIVRRRINKIIEASGVMRGGHSANAISNLLEKWPRDELFQTDHKTLAPMLLGTLQLVGRPRTRLFVRKDRFNRFIIALVYVHREAYDSDVRFRIGSLLEERYGGRIVSFEPSFDSGSLVRVHFQVSIKSDSPFPEPSSLEPEIAKIVETWTDQYRKAISNADQDRATIDQLLMFRHAFTAAYREAFSAEEAITDVDEIALLSADNPISVRAYRKSSDASDTIRAKIYNRDGSIPLSDCIPILENMGLYTEYEVGYPVRPTSKPVDDAPDTYWLHYLSMRTRSGQTIDLDGVKKQFQDAFVDIWCETSDNDSFNHLVLSAGASSREVSLIRALCAFRFQSGMDPNQITQATAFVAYTGLTLALLDLFACRFDPEKNLSLTARQSRQQEILNTIETGLRSVESLEHDRVIRRAVALVCSIQRTNYYNTDSPTISFKISSRELDHLPAPKPLREIFAFSSLVEGCHLRFGPVARGGLRWSDRRNDYRTEVLGLVKAQQVKNSVIVPVGSKGGFFPKKLPVSGTREDFQAAGIQAYKHFVTSLLELTDNLVDDKVQRPANMVVWDSDDPYLVVAADKGTATFSDIANDISKRENFWLGDAFASGGSSGYDHKKMGITAKGAWEAVKRHFRETGKDIQKEPFTVLGIGDMSGDVFGNGMLLSKQTKLIAAFNHLHIFIDPNPEDLTKAWKERKRLFELPRSSWADYDKSLISKGGGVFSRKAKSIKLNNDLKQLTGLTDSEATPDTIIKCLLKADVELAWFGGIGTFVKAKEERNEDVGDRANDLIRIDAAELGAKIVGEGANLGMTQKARIAYAMRGGKANTDAIDNSAGVDSSDHEVNIKILASTAIRRGNLNQENRDELLASMTDDVAHHVLQHNYDQTGALSVAEKMAAIDHEAFEKLMVRLEESGILNRDVELLPRSEIMRERSQSKTWLTRPELAVLMAYTKIVLFDDLVASDLPDDLYFEETQANYFPKEIRRYSRAMSSHRLKREIISTVVANRTIDVAGPAILLRLRENTGASDPEIVRSIEMARKLIGLDDLLEQINKLDNRVSSDVQSSMVIDCTVALFKAATWLNHKEKRSSIVDTVKKYRPAMNEYRTIMSDEFSSFLAGQVSDRAKSLRSQHVPKTLAWEVASARQLAEGLNMASMALEDGLNVQKSAKAYFSIGNLLQIDRLKYDAVGALPDISYWDRMAARRKVFDLELMHSRATRNVLLTPIDVDSWISKNNEHHTSLLAILGELSRGQSWTFSKLALSVDAIKTFIEKAG